MSIRMQKKGSAVLLLLCASYSLIYMYPQTRNTLIRQSLHVWLCLGLTLLPIGAFPPRMPAEDAALSKSSSKSKSRTGAVEIEMKSVMYHFTDTIAVHVLHLSGRLIPAKEIPIFDDGHSFSIEIDAATISISTDALTHVLNEHVFAKRDSPLKGLAVSAQGNRLSIKGRLARKGDVPFESVGDLQLTPEGLIRLHTQHLKAAHLPMKGILDIFGVELVDVISTKKINGVSIEKDDVILDPEQLLPPPSIRGRLSRITIENGRIIQVFGKDRGQTGTNAPGKGNFMAFRGGTLRFGKLTMNDADLELIDTDSRDPFDFYFKRYQDQLVAGYTHTTPQFGLRVYMPDFNKIGTPPRTPDRKK